MRKALLILVVASSMGCVTSGTHKKLQDEYAASTKRLNGEIAERDKNIAALKKDLATKQAQIKKLDLEIVIKKKAIAALEAAGRGKDAQIASLQTSLSTVVKDRSRLRASAKQLQQALAEAAKRKAEADRRVAEFKDLLKRFKKLIDAGKLRVKIADGRMVLELPTDILFASGRAKLSKEGVTAIAEVTAVLVTMPKRRFQVEGHTDNVPISNARFRSNWQLAAARALNVVKEMVGIGLPGAHISAASFAEFRPVAENDTKDGRERNRRIEIVVTPDLSTLPGFKELNRAVAK